MFKLLLLNIPAVVVGVVSAAPGDRGPHLAQFEISKVGAQLATFRDSEITSGAIGFLSVDLNFSLVHCSVEIISQELLVMLRQLSYAIKNQLKAPKAPY